ncbi:catechol 2,3-dioxygenase [Paenibacillus endophyticus]|uniref:Catechol 2,3-dioxygenase n=1 Tax=Paenibacillus endophyticus TaxID=1294268 RepID=A0A7W5CDZ4_9BACL|nr:VOC family protein [Paenibacillus endophyticus]MBB3155490.1 catechol 2,3-dioxygenase [Paenibacillus endophyticus]
MPAILDPHISLGEVKLKISQLERSIRFYEEVVGLKVLSLDEAKREVSFTADGKTTLLVLEEVPNALVKQRRSHAGLYHFAILLPDRQALSLALHNLIRSGIPIGQADHLVSEALYIEDPDHNGIEIYRDRPRSEWTQDAGGNYVMASDPLDMESLLAESSGLEWSGLPAGTVIGHIHLHVGDLRTSKAFYEGKLGFDVVGDYAQMSAVFVSAGGYHHHIGMNIWAGIGAVLPPSNAVGLSYFTIVFPSTASREAWLTALQAEGIETKQQDLAVVVHDPSGIAIHTVVAAG